ncbi:hypothetical protein NBRC3255_2685 [Gluconobacter thailandicus NBRC 3255]|nr:hypothetical protein NBRC3255_2685 [Gluconobacter thailandicus NBRC 3255]
MNPVCVSLAAGGNVPYINPQIFPSLTRGDADGFFVRLVIFGDQVSGFMILREK